MDIESFMDKVNSSEEKKPEYGNEDYPKNNFDYYNKLSINDKTTKVIRCPKNRLSYEVIWDESKKHRNIFILFNPSIANSDILDGTLKNCAKICYALNQKPENKEKECGGMIIYNTFTVRHPKIEEAIKNIDIEYEKSNNPIFKLSENSTHNISYLIVAWGNDARKKLSRDYYESLKEELRKIHKHNKIYAFHLNKSGTKQPAHPSPRCNRLINDFIKSPNLEELNSQNFDL